MAVRTRIELVLSSVTERHVKPLHHRTIFGGEEEIRTLAPVSWSAPLARASLIATWVLLQNQMAEKLGFEPRHRINDLSVFKTGPFSHLGTSPLVFKMPFSWFRKTRAFTDASWHTPTNLFVGWIGLILVKIRGHFSFYLAAPTRLELVTCRLTAGCSTYWATGPKK